MSQVKFHFLTPSVTTAYYASKDCVEVRGVLSRESHEVGDDLKVSGLTTSTISFTAKDGKKVKISGVTNGTTVYKTIKGIK